MTLRVGVYSIALNEAKFVDRWAESCAEADYRFVVDTGSRDDTVNRLQKCGVDVEFATIRSFRFDDARNISLHLLPAELDVVICLDMDEIMLPGWRTHLEQYWTETTTRLRYRYVWSWTAHKQPDLIYYADKISGRFTHRWKHPVHEILHPTVPEVVTTCDEILVEHHPDSNKPRSAYLPLLQLAVQEDPSDDRNAHYLGREYYFHQQYTQAITELERHLALPRATWAAERAASMRYLAKCHQALGDYVQARNWFIRATLEDPNSREAWLDLAQYWLNQAAYYAVVDCCQRVIALPTTSYYMAERYAQTEGAYDLMAVAFFYIGDLTKAKTFAEIAVSLNPHDPRLGKNLGMVTASTH